MENETSLKVLSEETNKDFNLNNLKKLDKNTNLVKPARESGLELLRIIAMLMIILHHVILYTGFNITSEGVFKLANVLKNGGKLGVDIFVLISAYFMVNKNFKLSRVLNIFFQTWFYSVVIYLIFLISGTIQFDLKMLFQAIFPLIYGEYEFVTSYVMLLFLSPWLNLIIKNINKNFYKIGLFFLLVLIVLFPYFNKLILKQFIEFPNINMLVWFVVLYFVAGYIRLYKIKVNKLILVIFLALFVLFQVIYAIKFDNRESYYNYAFGNISISITLFLIFKDFKFRSKIINIIASTTFGIFLIHENPAIRNWWWSKLFGWLGSSYQMFVGICLLMMLITFIICMVIDLIRINTVHRLTKKLLVKIDKVEEKIKVKYQEKENGK